MVPKGPAGAIATGAREGPPSRPATETTRVPVAPEVTPTCAPLRPTPGAEPPMAAVGCVKRAAGRPTARVGLDRRPYIGMARRPRGVTPPQATVATAQAEAEATRPAVSMLPPERASVERRTTTATAAAGALARLARAAPRTFLDGAPLAIGVAPAVARPLVRPARALSAERAVVQVTKVGLMVPRLRPFAPAPLALQTSVGPSGAERVVITAVNASATDEARKGRTEAPALRPGTPLHGARTTSAERRRGLLAPIAPEMGGPLAAPAEMGPTLAPATPAAGAVMVRRLMVGRTLLRERRRAKTVR